MDANIRIHRNNYIVHMTASCYCLIMSLTFSIYAVMFFNIKRYVDGLIASTLAVFFGGLFAYSFYKHINRRNDFRAECIAECPADIEVPVVPVVPAGTLHSPEGLPEYLDEIKITLSIEDMVKLEQAQYTAKNENAVVIGEAKKDLDF